MLLSSLRRLRLYCAGNTDEPISDTPKNNRMLSQWLGSASLQIENFLNRFMEIKEYTEYFDMMFQRTEFFMHARPISAITSVYTEPSGIWDGRETLLTDCFVGSDGNSISLPIGMPWISKKGIRFIYIGGMAYHAVNTTITLTSGSGTWTAGKYARDANGALGIIISYTPATKALVIEGYYGTFSVGASISSYDAESGSAAITTDTIAAIPQPSLAQLYPDIVLACEAQVRYQWKYALDFEKSSIAKDNVLIKQKGSITVGGTPFIEEVYNMLLPYRKIEI